MKQNVSQINGGITINIDVCVKNIYVIMFGIPLHVIVKMENILQVLWMFNDYLWWIYKIIRWTNKNHSNKF